MNRRQKSPCYTHIQASRLHHEKLDSWGQVIWGTEAASQELQVSDPRSGTKIKETGSTKKKQTDQRDDLIRSPIVVIAQL